MDKSNSKEIKMLNGFPILEHQSDLGTGTNGHLTLKYEHMFVEINKIAFKIHALPFISTELFQETKC